MKATKKQKQQMQKYYLENKDRLKWYKKSYYNSHKGIWIKYQNTDEYRRSTLERYRKMRTDVIRIYGNKCRCCNEKRIEFLAIDHIKGGGNKHRRAVGNNIYLFLKKNNYPREGYRVLCHNCNLSRGFYGYCPHKLHGIEL